MAIAASFALGKALEVSGAAAAIGGTVMTLAADNAWAALAIVYVVTLVVTEMITNNAAAALMFPLAISTAEKLGANYFPFIIVVMMAASAGFATPIGYQTNLMVYGPGGYRFGDYLRIGVPLDILIAIVTVALTPFSYPTVSMSRLVPRIASSPLSASTTLPSRTTLSTTITAPGLDSRSAHAK